MPRVPRNSQRLPDLLSVAELAAYTGYCKTVIYDWLKNGCPHLKRRGTRGKFLIPRDRALAWIDEQVIHGKNQQAAS